MKKYFTNTILLLVFSASALANISIPRLILSGYKVIASGGDDVDGSSNNAWIMVQKGKDFKLCNFSFTNKTSSYTSSCYSLK